MRNYKFRVKDIKKIDKELCKFMKVCKDCGELKLIIKFGKNKGMKDRHRNQCYSCNDNHGKKINKICEYCSEEFKGRKKQRFCSKECRDKWYGSNHKGKNNPHYKGGKMEVKCKYCNKIKYIYPSEYKRNSYFCNQECRTRWTEEQHTIKCSCSYCGKIRYIPLNQYKRTKYNFCNKECYDKWQKDNIPKGRNHYLYGKRRPDISGELNSNWNPNLTQEEREKGRHIEGYNEWRIEVYKRDKYTCQITGDNKGGNLVAHHLYSYADYPELRMDVNNGITLTEEIHRLFHNTYGYKHNTKEQFDEFVIRYNNGEFKEILDK